MWRFLHSTAANHSLCQKTEQNPNQSPAVNSIRNIYTAKSYNAHQKRNIGPSVHSTKMSNELLGNFHPFEKLLKETIGKTLLNGGDVLLHVLKTPEDGGKMD